MSAGLRLPTEASKSNTMTAFTFMHLSLTEFILSLAGAFAFGWTLCAWLKNREILLVANEFYVAGATGKPFKKRK